MRSGDQWFWDEQIRQRRRRWAGVGPKILLSATSIDVDAEVGDLIGLLSVANSPDGVTWEFTLDDGTSSQLELDGDDDTRLLVAEALDFETVPLLTAVVVATPSEGDPIPRTFVIQVLDVVEPEGPENGIQLETGDFLLAENGDYIVKEAA